MSYYTQSKARNIQKEALLEKKRLNAMLEEVNLVQSHINYENL